MELPLRPTLNSVTTIRGDGSRRFLYPADVSGRFARLRRISAAGLILVYLSLPWIPVNGYPAVFLDVVERRFHLFGFTLAAQDLWLLFFLITGLGFGLFFITAALGRIWCGWACPQTVFLDHVFRRVERWIDGDPIRRRALADAPWGFNKVVRRVLKHGLYVLFAALIAHLFLSYFVSLPAVWQMILAAPGEHWGAFVFMVAATGMIYFNFAWFREQLCIVICPYGRLQSALIDDNSLIIGYDARRGEPRGFRPAVPGANLAAGLAEERFGDCVNCTRCVQVCPTGIDIRNGVQMECIGCSACVDACDDIMAKLHRPKGLIRYDSMVGLAGGKTRWLRPRMALYGVLCLAGMSVALWAFSTVRPANVEVTRMVGAPFVIDPGFIRNQFLVRIVNKRNEPAHFFVRIGPISPEVHQVGGTDRVDVPALGEVVLPLIVEEDRTAYRGPFELTVTVYGDAYLTLPKRAEFLGPDPLFLSLVAAPSPSPGPAK